MSPKEYIPGDTVFAKLKGYPWWPARVENDKDIPAKVLKQKGKTKGLLYTVFFYGSRDYGFFGPDCVRPFDRATVERDLKAKKFKTKDLETAIHQALDPSILKKMEEEAEAAEDDDEEEEEEEDDDDEEENTEQVVTKPKRKERKKPVAAAADKKKKPAPKKRVTKKKVEEDEEEEEEDEEKATKTMKKPASVSSKRSRMSPTPDLVDSKKRRKSSSTEQDEEHRGNRELSAMSRKSEEPNNGGGNIEKQGELELFKRTPEYKRIYHFRHKLQKLVYEKKPGEIQKEDYPKVSQVVKEIEDATMTYDLLRYTKIGKVVKFASNYEYEDDEYKISERCLQIMKNWKSLLLPENTRSASVEQS